MERKDYLILFGILLAAALLRFWGVDSMHWALSNHLDAAPHFNFLFGHTSDVGFLPMPNFGTAAPYANLILGTLTVLSMFFVGLEFSGEKKGKNVALFCALFSAIAPLAIYFTKSQNTYTPVLLINSLFVLFAIKIFNATRKKGTHNATNWTVLLTLALLMIAIHPTSIIFALITAIALIIFSNKKAVTDGNMTKLVGIILLLSPIAFFIFLKMYITFGRAFFSLSDFCSFYIANTSGTTPELSGLVHNKITLGIGFFGFVVLPLLITAICILKNFLKPKSADFCFGLIAISSYFTLLVLSSLAHFSFITNYIFEIYPIIILLFSAGIVSFKSNSTKAILASLYIVLNLFYLVILNTTSLRLI